MPHDKPHAYCGAMPGTLLWDIDGTLIDMRGGAADKHAQAFATALGMPVPANPVTAGKTDGQIMAEIAAALDVPLTPELLTAMYAELTAITAAELALQSAEPTPGVVRFITETTALGWRQGLLTGNIPDRALIKLASAGLTDYLDPAVSFTGQHPQPRTELGRQAAAALDSAGRSGPCIVIGDTPLDIAAARAGGFAVLAVATGNFDVLALEAYEPDLVVRDLHRDRQLVDEFLASTDSA